MDGGRAESLFCTIIVLQVEETGTTITLYGSITYKIGSQPIFIVNINHEIFR